MAKKLIYKASGRAPTTSKKAAKPKATKVKPSVGGRTPGEVSHQQALTKGPAPGKPAKIKATATPTKVYSGGLRTKSEAQRQKVRKARRHIKTDSLLQGIARNDYAPPKKLPTGRRLKKAQNVISESAALGGRLNIRDLKTLDKPLPIGLVGDVMSEAELKKLPEWKREELPSEAALRVASQAQSRQSNLGKPGDLTNAILLATGVAEARAAWTLAREGAKRVGPALGIGGASRAAAGRGAATQIPRNVATSGAGKGVARAETRAAERAAGKKVKPLEKGTQLGRRRTSKVAARKRIGEPRKTRVPRSKAEAGARARRQWKKRKPGVLHKPGRQLWWRDKLRDLAGPGIVAGAATPPLIEGGRRYVEATKEDPGKVIGTTTRVAPAMATATIGLPADAVAAVKQGSTDPLKGFWEGQKDYYKTLGTIVGDDEEAAKKAIKEDIGLIPLITGGLTAGAAGKAAGVHVPTARAGRVRRARRQLKEGDRPQRARARKKLDEMDAPLNAAHKERVRESRRAANTGERQESQWKRETKSPARRDKLGRRKSLARELEQLDRRNITEKVTYGDIAQFTGRNDLHHKSPAEVKRAVARVLKGMRESSEDIPADEKATRDILEALEKHPEAVREVAPLLDDWGKMQAGRSVERHTERTGERQTTPDPEDERARLFHTARREGVPMDDERVLTELRGKTKVKAASRQNAEQAIRKEISQRRKDIRALFQLARTSEMRAHEAGARQAPAKGKPNPNQRPTVVNERAAQLHSEAEMARQTARQLQDQNAEITSVLDRKRKAAALERRAVKIEKEKPNKAAGLRTEAVALRNTATKADRELRNELGQEMRDKDLGQGAIYFKESDVTDKGLLNVLRDFPAGGLPAKEKRRIGDLADEGRIDEAAGAMLENAYRGRAAMEMRTHAKGFFDEKLLEVEGAKIRSGPAARKLAEQGKVPPGTALVDISEMTRVFQRGAWDEASGMIDNALMSEVRTTRYQKGHRYGMVSKPALKEFRGQMEPYSKKLKVVRVLARVQSMALIALAPLWFGFQLAASPLAAFVAHPNPLRWAKATKQYLADWRKIPKADRINFQSEYGGTMADAIALHRSQIGMQASTVRNQASAAGVALRSLAGRALEAVADSARRGGPLIQANRAYENVIRDLTALVVNDKQINPARFYRYAGKVAGAHELAYTHMKHLRGKSLREQMDFYRTNQVAAKQLGDGVNDAIGEWAALTVTERGAAAVTIFYPFLRFSTRWLMVAYPKNHPVKAAVLANLAQANAIQLEEKLGGDPSFFPEWGKIVTHTGPGGSVETGIPTSRFAPGSGAVAETIGSGKLDLTIGRPLQPILSAGVSALAGKDPLSGQDSTKSGWEIFAKSLVGLPVPLRAEARKIGGQSDPSKLFEAILGRPKGLARDVVPQLTTDLDRDRKAVTLGRLYDEAYGDDPKKSEKAWKRINAMMIQYGIQTKASQAKSKDKAMKERFPPQPTAGSQFGIPSTSSESLKEQFGIQGSSSEELKEQFGIR